MFYRQEIRDFVIQLLTNNNTCVFILIATVSVEKPVSSILKSHKSTQWGAFYLFIANFFATQFIGGAKELVVLLGLGGDI